ncbi:low-specificity L-threonine aldolase [Aliidiomarina sanyensis]|uniref:Low-specificity L-threonine aldolase n=1 Tax=Aliidiomarina sanyensis TaxID=1249555 RepID=A0A432WSC3_9GAMM|nr:low-specificity L-threonine aldolase [Aliidiomarina sanyensis]RUO36671.1 low-specificity L-threonine aldolase [Aliidiomarina sanyensis]
MNWIDLRSDTVTQPTEAMREAMARAKTGDDVYGEDPSVNALEERVAALTGKAAALLCTSGTQSNLLGLLSHCQRGEEYLVGEEYHTYRYEAGGAAVLGGIVPQTLTVQSDGTLDRDALKSKIKVDDPHFPMTRLIALENTHTGKVMPNGFIQSVRSLADIHGLSVHLDGARLWNAHIASQSSISDLCQDVDSVSLCFSKGLGTPIGSVLTGSEAFIKRARRWRKMLGGGMRQAGVIAASLDYALDHHVERLVEDHRNARMLAEGLKGISGFTVEPVQTNMVYLEVESMERAKEIQEKLWAQHIKVPASKRMRLVTHLDIQEQDIQMVIDAFRSV